MQDNTSFKIATGLLWRTTFTYVIGSIANSTIFKDHLFSIDLEEAKQ